MLRLDKNLLPTRNRFATLSTAELDKLRKVKKVIRKGRLEAVTVSALVFLSGEQVELEDTNCCLSPVQQPEDLDPITQHMSSLTVSMPAPLPDSPPPSPRPNLR